MIIQVFCMDINFYFFSHYLLGRLKQIQLLFVDVIYPLKTRTAFNRPCQRTNIDNQFFFQFIQQVERIFCFTVHLVDENNNRSVTHTTYFHQLTCLRFHTLCTIHNNNNTIYSSKCTVSIFRKVLVSRSI